MAAPKKMVNATVDTTAKAVKEAEKAEPAKSAVKAEPVKEAEKAEVKEAVKAVAKPVAQKPVADKKPAAKKATVKKPAKKAEFKSELHVQFEGKSYSQEDLLKIAKDVWKYDLKQKARELSSVELYVKPEENMVYYVMNKEFTGSFYI